MIARGRSCKNGGHSTLELVLGITVMSLVALLVLDAALLAYSMSLNDDSCKEAARQASRGPISEAPKRARAVIENLARKGSAPFVNLRLVSFENSIKEADLQKLGLYQGVVNGTITVETEVAPTLPLVSGWMLPQVRLRSRHVFPVTHIVRAGEPASPL